MWTPSRIYSVLFTPWFTSICWWHTPRPFGANQYLIRHDLEAVLLQGPETKWGPPCRGMTVLGRHPPRPHVHISESSVTLLHFQLDLCPHFVWPPVNLNCTGRCLCSPGPWIFHYSCCVMNWVGFDISLCARFHSLALYGRFNYQ